MSEGRLYIIGTPIGNRSDLTLRARELLDRVDILYAEDTRVTQRLGISVPLRSYRETAPRPQVEKTVDAIIALLGEGKTVGYVSDAGTPGISDPGNYLVQRVIAAGFPVLPIPGVSALTTLLSVAGFPASRVLFVGFLPRKKGHVTLLRQLAETLRQGTADTLVFYESPERIVKLLRELLEWSMPLQACLGRELTKQFEEILRGDITALLATLEARPQIKGEITLLIRCTNA